MKTTKIAISNQKGGIGKTTTAIELFSGLKRKGYKVLMIDSDPQRSTTGVFGAKIEGSATLADMLYSGEDALECIQTTEMGEIIASDLILSEADTKIPADADRFYHLADTCGKLEGKYDYIIFDTPPGNGVLLGNVLSYVDYVIMPVTCDKFGVQGMMDFNNSLEKYKKRINPRLRILGILKIKYKGRQSLTRDLEDNLLPAQAEEMNTKIFNTKIRESVKCQEAQALGKSVMDYEPTCTTSIDYTTFVEEFLREAKNNG